MFLVCWPSEPCAASSIAASPDTGSGYRLRHKYIRLISTHNTLLSDWLRNQDLAIPAGKWHEGIVCSPGSQSFLATTAAADAEAEMATPKAAQEARRPPRSGKGMLELSAGFPSDAKEMLPPAWQRRSAHRPAQCSFFGKSQTGRSRGCQTHRK